MFDQLKNLGQIMRNVGKIREQMDQMKAELKTMRVEAETGGGAVRAVATGNGRLVSLHVDPAMLGALIDLDRADDRALAEDLIAGAVNAALEKAQEQAAAEFARRTQEEFGLPPGTDLQSLLGEESKE